MRARLARIASLSGLAVLVLGLLAGAPAASASQGFGYLRLAHLSPNTPAVDVYLYSFHDAKAMFVVHHVAYGTVSGYEKIPAGEYTVAMRMAGAANKSAPVISATVNILPGAAYTVAGVGPANGLRLRVLRDRLTTPKGKALVRIIQASLLQHRVTIRAGRTVLARQLGFGTVTSYQAVRPGTWVVSADGRTSSTSSAYTFGAGTIHTVVVLDGNGHLALDDLVDAAGSRVMPSGAPATGFGGTAPVPGLPLLPWALLIAAGVLLGAAGLVAARQPVFVRMSRLPRCSRP